MKTVGLSGPPKAQESDQMKPCLKPKDSDSLLFCFCFYFITKLIFYLDNLSKEFQNGLF